MSLPSKHMNLSQHKVPKLSVEGWGACLKLRACLKCYSEWKKSCTSWEIWNPALPAKNEKHSMATGAEQDNSLVFVCSWRCCHKDLEYINGHTSKKSTSKIRIVKPFAFIIIWIMISWGIYVVRTSLQSIANCNSQMNWFTTMAHNV